MSTGRRRFLAVSGGLLLLPRVVWAAEVTVAVQLSARRAALGEAIHMRVKVQEEGSGGVALPEPSIAAIDGIAIERQGPPSTSSSTIFANGRAFVSRSLSFDYVLVPSKIGKFSLDVHVVVDGKPIRSSQTPSIEIVDGSQAGQGPGSAPQPRGDLFLWPTVDKKRVYVGEPVVYTFELWTRVDDQVQIRGLPTFKDFWSEELAFDDEPRRAALDGEVYRVHPLLRRALFPQKAGRLPIGGAEIEAHPSAFASLFSRRRRVAPRLIRGPELEIEALPLPAQGQPVGFASNNVGRFEVSAAIDRNAVDVGEGLTLTLTIAGTGNLRFVEPGEFAAIDGARRYDPQDELDLQLDADGALGGSRRYKFLIVPERPGELTIPAHTLNFFDPRAERYAAASSEPLTVQVRGSETKVEEVTTPTPSVANADDDAVFAPIVESEPIPRTTVASPFWTPSGWTSAVVSAPLTVIAVWGGVAVRRRFGPDDQTKQRLARDATRREQLATASAAVETGEGFFVAVGDLVHGVVMEQMGDAGEGLHREQLLRRLRDRGVASETLVRAKSVLDRADAARFGADDSTPAQRRECLDTAKGLLDPNVWRAK